LCSLKTALNDSRAAMLSTFVISKLIRRGNHPLSIWKCLRVAVIISYECNYRQHECDVACSAVFPLYFQRRGPFGHAGADDPVMPASVIGPQGLDQQRCTQLGDFTLVITELRENGVGVLSERRPG
jgi:hypothetical protein